MGFLDRFKKKEQEKETLWTNVPLQVNTLCAELKKN
jgi:hypothetical protein